MTRHTPRQAPTSALVVMPTYDEHDNIRQAVTSALAADDRVEVLVVDDGSPDGTADLVAQIAVGEPRLHLMRRTGKGGLGSAYRAGFAWALERGYDAVVEMDADLSHPADRLPAMLDGLAGADLVIGSRWVPGGATTGWPWHRQALSRAGNLYVRIMLGLGVRDATAGFRAFSREALGTIAEAGLDSEGYCFQVESTFVARRLGFTVTEVPITFTERVEGVSKMSSTIVLEALARVTGWAFGVGRPTAVRRGVAPADGPGEGGRRPAALTPAGRVGLGLAVLAIVGGIAAAANAAGTAGPRAGTTSPATSTTRQDAAAPTTAVPSPSGDSTGATTAGGGGRDAGSEDTAVPGPGSVVRTPAGDVPVRLRIAAIGVDSSLVDLGIAADGTMQVPKDYSKAGWLSSAPAPGARGPAVIAGHVDDQDGPAVFYRLGELEPGDQVEVTQRDGDVVSFTVRAVEDFAKDAFPTAKVYGPVPGPVLRLITCSGTFDRATGHYTDNTVVFAS